MKRNIHPQIQRFFLLISILLLECCVLAACSKDNRAVNSKKDPEAKANAYMPIKEGTKFTYEITQGEELGLKSLYTFKNIHPVEGFTQADVLIETSGLKITGIVKSNAEKTYAVSFLPPAYAALLHTMAQIYTGEFTHEEQPYVIVLPHKDPLDKIAASQTVSVKMHGMVKDELTKTVVDYTQTESEAIIDSMETITTKAGSFDCIRVHYQVTTHNKTIITDDEGPRVMDVTMKFEETGWYAKGIGAVRTKEINLQTLAVSINELTKIETP